MNRTKNSTAQTGEATAKAESSISDALDELAYARAEALIAIHLLESELVRNPNEPGYTYALTLDQEDMLHHVAALVHGSIGRAIAKLEAAR